MIARKNVCKLFTISLVFIISLIKSYSQTSFKCNSHEINNIIVSIEGSRLEINYDFLNLDKEYYNIDVYIYLENGKSYKAENIEGDFKNVKSGFQKKIFWNLIDDKLKLMGEIKIKLQAVKVSPPFHFNLSAGYLIPTKRTRIQLEIPIKNEIKFLNSGGLSMGVNYNDYSGEFSNIPNGYTIEPFIRFYEADFDEYYAFDDYFGFIQLKAIFGQLNGRSISNELINTKSFVNGAAVNVGLKKNFLKILTFEMLTGLRFLSKPTNIYTGKSFFWYISTGCPIDLQIKLGIQL
jgi:hypothetical protein